MKLGFFICVIMIFGSCNLAKWNQNRLTKKFVKKDVKEAFFTNEEHRVHYFEGGTGKTILLIHGFGGDAQITWYKTIMDLSKDYHVIAPDLLWFGQSKSKAEPDLNAQVDAMFDLLADRGVEKCAVAGISYGGFVTSGMFYKQPDFITDVCLIDSPGVTYDAALLDVLCEKENVKTVDEIFVVEDANALKRLYDLAFYKKQHIPKSILKDAYHLYFAENHTELRGLIHSLKNNADDYLVQDAIGFPNAAVIWGENDAVFPLSEGEKVAKFMGAKFHVIPDAGHAPNIEKFKEFEGLLRNWILGN